MNNYDYVVLIDENGQPYIAHSLLGKVSSGVKKAYGSARSAAGRATRTAHKYLLKVGEGAKAQYAYTKEDVDRLMGRGRQKVQQTAEKAKDTVNKGREALRTAGNNAREKARDVMGYDERERLSSATKKREAAATASAQADARWEKTADQTWEEEFGRRNGRGVSPEKSNERWWRDAFAKSEANRALLDAQSDERKAYLDYAKTPLAMIDRAKESLSSLKSSIKDYVDVPLNKAKDFLGFDERDAMEKARQEYSEYSDKAHVANDRYKASEKKEKEARDAEEQAWNNYSEKVTEHNASIKALEAAKDAVDSSNASYKSASERRDAQKAYWDSLDDSFTDKLTLALSSGARDRRDEAYQAFVDSGMKAADAKVAADQAVRAYDAALKKEREAAEANDSARQAHKEAQERYDEVVKEANAASFDRHNAVWDMQSAAANRDLAERVYAKTPLAKIENATTAAKNFVNETAGNLKEAYNKRQSALQKVEPAAAKVVGAVTNSVSSVNSFFSNLPTTVKNSAAAREAKQILAKMADGKSVSEADQTTALTWLFNHSKWI